MTTRSEALRPRRSFDSGVVPALVVASGFGVLLAFWLLGVVLGAESA